MSWLRRRRETRRRIGEAIQFFRMWADDFREDLDWLDAMACQEAELRTLPEVLR